MRLLILGGTKFLGPHIMDAARARGDDVTIFHRGHTRFALPEGVHEILGDRTGSDIERVGGTLWDGVIDTSAYEADVAENAARMLKAVTKRYIFVSTISVYSDTSRPGMGEEGPLYPPDAGEAYKYGSGKAACEAALREILGDRVTIVRPGLIVGPYDPTDRFTYWVERLARGGDIVAPGPPQRPVQFIDVRDIAAWMVDLVARDVPGTFNATSPEVTMGEVLAAGMAAVPAERERSLVWVPEDVLKAADVGAWMELPLWIPEDPQYAGFLRIDASKARAAGLQTRELGETFADTYAWVRTLPADRKREAGLAPEREIELLRRYASARK